MAKLLRHSIDLEDRIRWLEKGLKLVIKIANDKESGLVMAAQAVLDGEPTTADEHNEENFPDDRNKGVAVLTSGMDALAKDNKKYVRISDINKEIAKEWNREREERINKEKTK